jgi:hypothetical protein
LALQLCVTTDHEDGVPPQADGARALDVSPGSLPRQRGPARRVCPVGVPRPVPSRYVHHRLLRPAQAAHQSSSRRWSPRPRAVPGDQRSSWPELQIQSGDLHDHRHEAVAFIPTRSQLSSSRGKPSAAHRQDGGSYDYDGYLILRCSGYSQAAVPGTATIVFVIKQE